MAVYLVRHAKAGARGYGAADEQRALTDAGWQQADALAGWLGPLATGRLLSSPYLRCRQTLEPLSARIGREVESVVWLSEAMPFGPVLDQLLELPDGSVLCSHGDLIPDVVAALIRRGTLTLGEPRWEKGSAWVLERDTESVVTALPVAAGYSL